MSLHRRHFIVLYFLTIMVYTSVLLSQSPNDKENLSSDPLVEIIYHANLNGNIENCGCGDPALGGLSRIVSLVKEKKELNPELLFIDGGDFCNTYPFPELNQCVLDIYNYYPPDLLLIGDQEFIQGVDFISTFLGQQKNQIIGTNLRMSGHDFSKVKDIKIRGMKIAITTYLDSSAFMFLNKDKNLTLDQDRFEQTYQRIKDHDAVIVVFHGSASVLQDFKKRYPEVTLILFAHEQSRQVNNIRPPFVVGGGADGESLNWISLHKQASRFRLENIQISISKDIQPDKTVEDFIETYKTRLK